MRKLLLIFLLVIGLVGVFFGLQYYQKQQIVKAVDSYEACAKYFPVMTSYPARCVTSDGRSFTQEIGNELQYTDEIRVNAPRPNQVVVSLLTVGGEARGTWFFEADFPIELLDANGKSLGVGHAQAKGEWMTENFVPFEGKIPFENSTTSTGTLIIKNANPSGLPENQKELKIPVRFSE